MNHVVTGGFFAVFLFVGMLVLLEVGRRWGTRRLAFDIEGARQGLGAIDGAIFALLGLLIAFTFSGAATRFDARRALIVEETNDIGTAWLRLDLLPAEAQPALRESFRRYVDSRLEVYRKLPDVAAAFEALVQSNALQGEIWNRAIAASREGAAPSAPMLLFPALNAMFDITTTRTAAARFHPPPIVFVMLGLTALVSALLAGYGMAGGKKRSLIHMLSFAIITAVAAFVILDLEYPRTGFIRIEAADQALVDLRQTMN
ncbi:MAG: DUF4239 domain-containing protein [Bryobacteraceae bacterium]